MHPITDAFWKGRAVLKKGTGAYFDSEKKPKKACALGAIYYGLYKNTADPRNDSTPLKISMDFPEIRSWVEVPCEHDDRGIISSILIHLNDEHTGHDWPDKRIAEWLDNVLSQ